MIKITTTPDPNDAMNHQVKTIEVTGCLPMLFFLLWTGLGMYGLFHLFAGK